MYKYIIAATLLTYTAAHANTKAIASQSAEVAPLQIPWDVIGTYETVLSNRTIKFLPPAGDCVVSDELASKDDFLLQLRNCHQKRKGWLKI